MVRDAFAHGREFDLGGGPDAVLLLHGLTGSTFELYPVAEILHARGMRCLAPVMAGHGGRPEDLIGVPWTEWVAKASRDLARLEGARRIFVVGCSMGALVACALAQAHPDRVSAMALLAPALALRPSGRLGALLGRLAPFRRVVVHKRAGSDVRDLDMRRANPCMDGVPLAAVAELTRLAAHVDRQLPAVGAPALVVAGGNDHTVSNAGVRRLARRLGGGRAGLLVLEQSWHLVGIDVERDRCAEAVARFFADQPLARSGRREPAASTDSRRPTGAGAR